MRTRSLQSALISLSLPGQARPKSARILWLGQALLGLGPSDKAFHASSLAGPFPRFFRFDYVEKSGAQAEIISLYYIFKY
jgi:hypothetical protein